MKIIVGLGNPGEKFKNTRHNTGFLVLDKLKTRISNFQFPISNKFSIPNFQFQKKLKAEILDLRPYNLDLILVKPQTFMNNSGLAVKKIIDYYFPPPPRSPSFYAKATKDKSATSKVSLALYIIHDDLDIPLGEYKIQFGRSAAGHNGVQSIIDALGTKDFWRVRIGINNKEKPAFALEATQRLIQPCLPRDATAGKDFVLQKFNKEEKKIIDNVIKQIIERLSSDCS